jgi:thioesterase domain-containing protein
MLKEKIYKLQERLNRNIPITKSMGVEILKFDDSGLVINAPLHLNKNDKGTAFAGSLYSVAVLTGWAYISEKLKEEGLDVEVAVYSSSITYLNPVTADFKAVCNVLCNDAWVNFRERVKKKSNGKISLSVDIIHNEEIKVSFKGEYYAWLKKINNYIYT